MNAKVHPLVVILVILLTFLAIGVWVWGSGAAKNLGGPSELKVDPDGHLYIQIQNQLLEHDASGVFLQRHDLGELGVEILLGGVGFFSNGEVLLRRGPDPRTLSQNIRAYQRRTNEQSLQPQTPDTGLHRCNLDSLTCELFGPDGIDFKAAHGIFIDWNTDEVYITDTTRHLLRKYSSAGEALVEPVGGFKFPNQLLMHEGSLYIANTNHHQVRKVDSRTASFGEEPEFFGVNPPAAIEAAQIWPSNVARVGNEWWVNNMRSGMNEGGIYIFDDGWNYDRRVTLPQDADPIALLPFGDEVLLSDWNNDRVYRISTTGKRLQDFTSPGLEEVLAESRTRRLQFEIYSYSGIGLFLFVIAGLFFKALTSGASADPARQLAIETAKTNAKLDEAIWLEPDPGMVRKNRLALRVAVLLIVLTTVLLAVFVLLSGNIEVGMQLLLPVGGLIGICAIIVWIGRVNTGTAIGFRGSTITLRDHTGRESTCPVRDVLYDHTAVATPDMAVFLGQPQMPIYEQQILKDQLFPRLADAQRVSILRMQAILIQIRHPQGMAALATVLGLAAGAIWWLIKNEM